MNEAEGQRELLALMQRRGEWYGAKIADSFMKLSAASGLGNPAAIAAWAVAVSAGIETAKAMMCSAGIPQFAIDEYEKTVVAKLKELIAAEIGRAQMIKLFRENGFTVGSA